MADTARSDSPDNRAAVVPRDAPEPGAASPRPERRSREPEPLWRHVVGERLRQRRQERGEKLTETAGRAGVSPQYLSEMERGLKEPSSEMIAAVAGALDLSLVDLTLDVAESLIRAEEALADGPVVSLSATRASFALAA